MSSSMTGTDGELVEEKLRVIDFVNGLPLVFFELKVFIVLSNGTASLVGTLTSDYKYFLEWKRIAEGREGEVSLSTMLHGTCDPARLLDLFKNFLLYDDAGGTVRKLMAKNHQYLGVNRVLENVRRIDELDGRLGVTTG